jgi:hypothetical protein
LNCTDVIETSMLRVHDEIISPGIQTPSFPNATNVQSKCMPQSTNLATPVISLLSLQTTY